MDAVDCPRSRGNLDTLPPARRPPRLGIHPPDHPQAVSGALWRIKSASAGGFLLLIFRGCRRGTLNLFALRGQKIISKRFTFSLTPGRAVLLCNQKRGRGQTAARKTNGGRKMETMKSEMIREAGDRGWKSLVRARNLKSGNHYRYYLRLGPRGGWKFSRATLPGWVRWAYNYYE